MMRVDLFLQPSIIKYAEYKNTPRSSWKSSSIHAIGRLKEDRGYHFEEASISCLRIGYQARPEMQRESHKVASASKRTYLRLLSSHAAPAFYPLAAATPSSAFDFGSCPSPFPIGTNRMTCNKASSEDDANYFWK